MPLFKRMKQMAKEAAEGRLKEPENDDDEGQTALRWLEKIWDNMRKELNQSHTGKSKVTRADIKDVGYYQQTLERIRRDEALVFDGWKKGEGGVSYNKQFTNAAERIKAQRIFAMVDLANGLITTHFTLPEEDMEIPELRPDADLRGKLAHRKKYAEKLAIRSDWMTEFSIAEQRPIGMVK